MKILKPIIMVLSILSIVYASIFGVTVFLTYAPPYIDVLNIWGVVVIGVYFATSIFGIMPSITMMISTNIYYKSLCNDISKTYRTLKAINLVISILSFVLFWVYIYLEIYVTGRLGIYSYRDFKHCTIFMCIICLIFNIVFLIVGKIIELVKKHKRYKRANDEKV